MISSELDFNLKKNIHAIVGQNNAGKTFLLQKIKAENPGLNSLYISSKKILNDEYEIDEYLINFSQENYDLFCRSLNNIIFNGVDFVPPSEDLIVSDGTKKIIAILTIAIASTTPALLLLDDLDAHLNPTTQTKLIREIEPIVSSNSKTIVFSTHSPYLIDGMEFSQVYVVSNFLVTRLDEHPEAKWAKSVLSTGEFWDANYCFFKGHKL